MFTVRPFSLLLGAVLLISIPLLAAGCGSDAQSKDTEEPEAEPAVPVEAASVIVGPASAYYSGTASLEAEEDALVVPKTSGIVTEVFVEEGSTVQQGAPLAQLDAERLRLELARTEAALAKLKRDFERNEDLHGKNLISAEEYERVRSDYETQKAAYDLATLDLEYSTVRAPISGVVSERHVKVGNMVRTSEPAFRITALRALRAVMHLPERELGKIRVGQPAQLTLDALPGEAFEGAVKLISPLVDPATGTFKVTIDVRDRSGQLKPGMFGRVHIVYDTRGEALLVPKEAVLAEDNESAIFVVHADGTAHRTIVQTGYTTGPHIEILDGVQAGDRVIVTGQSALRDSAKVEVIGQ